MIRLLLTIFLFSVPLGLAACSEEEPQNAENIVVEEVSALPLITVHKTPTCGCCNAWIDHLRENGFEVSAIDVENTTPIASRLGVPDNMRSCHTGEVDGYALEGHIPAEDIKRLLDERPDIAGLSVPGMPLGSPGMEAGGRTQPFTVFAIGHDGATEAFAQHN